MVDTLYSHESSTIPGSCATRADAVHTEHAGVVAATAIAAAKPVPQGAAATTATAITVRMAPTSYQSYQGPHQRVIFAKDPQTL